MTQRKLFPTMTTDEFFAGILILGMCLSFYIGFIGSYASEIGERIPRKPQLERDALNLESHYNTTYTKAIILKQYAEQLERDMDDAYETLCTPLKDTGKHGSYYNYYYLEVGNE